MKKKKQDYWGNLTRWDAPKKKKSVTRKPKPIKKQIHAKEKTKEKERPETERQRVLTNHEQEIKEMATAKADEKAPDAPKKKEHPIKVAVNNLEAAVKASNGAWTDAIQTALDDLKSKADALD